MNDSQKEVLISWLNSAHAMEESLVKSIEQMIKDAESAGEVDMMEALEEHLEETKRHVDDVESCVNSLGGELSSGKDLVGKVSGFLQGASKGVHDDNIVKNVIEGYAAENFEIACYTSLVAAATAMGKDEIADTCSKILDDEIRMANWLMDQIPVVTEEYLMAQE
jgi:ferritin-like metal-binding protein YciE